MSLISVDECFSSPQAPNIKSERLKVKVKTQGAGLTVAELKKAIVRKGYPSLCDASRITLILPVGGGRVLSDEMLASDLQDNASLLALISSSSHETTQLHKDGGLHIPHILYVYHSGTLRTHVKWPNYVTGPNAGQWSSWQTPWTASLPELYQQFTGIGFDANIVSRELKRLEHRRLPEDLVSSSLRGAGFLVPSLLFRLWDAVGLNKMIDAQKRGVLRTQSSGFEVTSASSTSSTSSIDTDTSEATVLRGSPRAPPATPPQPSGSGLPHATRSVVMGSPSEHESAYDEVFYQNFLPPTPTVQGSDCSSESGLSARTCSRMHWTPGNQPSGVTMSTSSRLSKIIRKVGELTRERDRLESDSRQAMQSGGSESAQFARLLEQQARQFEAERQHYAQELQTLASANVALRAEVEAEVRTVREVFEAIEMTRGDNEAARLAEQNTVKALQEIKDNLSNVVTCSICCERYGSLSVNVARRPIHLSCGHIFCASCLHSDWAHRAQAGLEARCFNRCANFDVNRLAEIYLLDDVKDVLERLPDVEMAE
ncbi:hypothetical protein PCANC_11358 [Puccinia coronata f. sp. avenae]|uniref:RING-type domain-containing protein n=1 Tax=Puccinia coronata f. sp. avenae TaxID=200324 RepID=A0A2N5VT29_9BASI|nr:hypothetical protein PCANC_11358 [Puccinia coronata f. sp. avenae]